MKRIFSTLCLALILASGSVRAADPDVPATPRQPASLDGAPAMGRPSLTLLAVAPEEASEEAPDSETEGRRKILSHVAAFRRATEQLLVVFGSALWLALLPLIGISIQILVILSAPVLTQSTVAILRESRPRSLFLGIINLAFLLFASAVVAHALGPVGHLLAFLMLVGGALAALLGATAVSEDLGHRALLLAGREGTRAGRILVGVPLAIYASCFPVLGWFVVLPILFLTGFGAAIVACWPGRVSPPPAAAPSPASPAPPPAGPPSGGSLS